MKTAAKVKTTDLAFSDWWGGNAAVFADALW
jgi:hypothetical protein